MIVLKFQKKIQKISNSSKHTYCKLLSNEVAVKLNMVLSGISLQEIFGNTYTERSALPSTEQVTSF